jgi:hypothetical protein
MRAVIWLIVCLLPALAHANSSWTQSTPEAVASAALHEGKCTTCHTRMYGGDGSGIYTRDGRVLSTRLDLLQRVAACSAQVSAGWFPDEEAGVAAWLNARYYRFGE